jgi:hypothetical protein
MKNLELELQVIQRNNSAKKEAFELIIANFQKFSVEAKARIAKFFEENDVQTQNLCHDLHLKGKLAEYKNILVEYKEHQSQTGQNYNEKRGELFADLKKETQLISAIISKIEADKNRIAELKTMQGKITAYFPIKDMAFQGAINPQFENDLKIIIEYEKINNKHVHFAPDVVDHQKKTKAKRLTVPEPEEKNLGLNDWEIAAVITAILVPLIIATIFTLPPIAAGLAVAVGSMWIAIGIVAAVSFTTGAVVSGTCGIVGAVQRAKEKTRPLSKLAPEDELQEISARRRRSELNVHEPLSTEMSQQIASGVGFRKRSTQEPGKPGTSVDEPGVEKGKITSLGKV